MLPLEKESKTLRTARAVTGSHKTAALKGEPALGGEEQPKFWNPTPYQGKYLP